MSSDHFEYGRLHIQYADLEPEFQSVTYDDDHAYGVDTTFADINKILKDIKLEMRKDPNFLRKANIGDLIDGAVWEPLSRHFKATYILLAYIIENLREIGGWDLVRKKVNERNGQGIPLLNQAIHWGRDECVDLLLLGGAEYVEPRGTISRAFGEMYHPEVKFNEQDQEKCWDLVYFQWYANNFTQYVCWLPSKGERNYKTFRAATLAQMRRIMIPECRNCIKEKDSLVWIHLPCTNGNIIMMILRFLDLPIPNGNPRYEGKKFTSFHGYVGQETLNTHIRQPTISPGDPSLDYREAMYRKGTSSTRDEIYSLNPTVVVFPWLAVTSMKRQKESRKRHEELREFWVSPRRQKMLHLDRTLDEAYHPGLGARDLKIRNKEQVVSRQAQKQDLPKNEIPILMVPHLWLWRYGRVVISASSMTRKCELFRLGEKSGLDSHGNPCSRPLYNSSDPDPWIISPTYVNFHPILQMGLLLVSHVESFGQKTEVDDVIFPPTLDQFEKDVASVLSDADKYVSNADSNKVDFYKERQMLNELLDIKGELEMIEHVLDQQIGVLQSLLEELRDVRSAKAKLCLDDHDDLPEEKVSEVEAALGTIGGYRKRIKKIDCDAERVEKSVKDMLNLKRTHASIKDAHTSMILGTAVIGFTIVTIIFAPLAFLTALFALKIDGFESLQIDVATGTYHSGKIASIFVSTELLTIGITVAAVFLSLRYIKRWDESQTKPNPPKSAEKNDVGRKSNSNQKKSSDKVKTQTTDIEAQEEKASTTKYERITKQWQTITARIKYRSAAKEATNETERKAPERAK